MQRLAFVGSSRADLKDCPEADRRKAGFQLNRLQRGLEPEDWKPMASIGQWRGCHQGERNIWCVSLDLCGVFRGTQRTSLRDIELATARFKELQGA